MAEDGFVIPLTGEWLASSVLFDAGGPLQPGDYSFRRSGLPADTTTWEEMMFTVGIGLPADTPDVPVGLERQWFQAWENRGDKLQVRWSESAGATYYEIEVAPTADFVTPSRGFTPSEPAQFGVTDCVPPVVSDYDSTTTNFLRIRAIGPLGDASDWSETLRVGPRPPQVCATGVGGSASAVGLLAALGLMRLRRRQTPA
ncbi:MAG: hypothetical protein AAF211_16925 [Myxococcota bacterium]